MLATASPSFRPSGSLPPSPLAPYAGTWGVRGAAHLLRRAGFGGSPADVARFSTLSMNAAVDALVSFPASPLALPASAAALPFAGAEQPALPPQELRAERARVDRENVLAWLERMVSTQAPLQEKMTLFLHGHFATANNTKGIYGSEIVDQNRLLRGYALGNWRELTHAIARDPAMLKWLDQARSVKAHPNENFARELLELFTLGIGNYSERDVREGARAFTGFSLARRNGPFRYRPDFHDDGEKTFLGRTGNFDGDDAIDIVFAQPATSRLFARKLLEFFVYTDPEPELVEQTAALVREHDFTMLPVMSTLFRSNVFHGERAYRALVKSPVEFVVGSYRLFGIDDVSPDVIAMLRRMGQVPYHPPSVKGWDGGAQWLNTQTILARENFANSLMGAVKRSESTWLTAGFAGGAREAAKMLVATILQGDAGPGSLAKLESYLAGAGGEADALSGENFEERMHAAAYLTMALPAYQLA